MNNLPRVIGKAPSELPPELFRRLLSQERERVRQEIEFFQRKNIPKTKAAKAVRSSLSELLEKKGISPEQLQEMIRRKVQSARKEVTQAVTSIPSSESQVSGIGVEMEIEKKTETKPHEKYDKWASELKTERESETIQGFRELTPGTPEWKDWWKKHPEEQEAMLSWKKQKGSVSLWVTIAFCAAALFVLLLHAYPN